MVLRDLIVLEAARQQSASAVLSRMYCKGNMCTVPVQFCQECTVKVTCVLYQCILVRNILYRYTVQSRSSLLQNVLSMCTVTRFSERADMYGNHVGGKGGGDSNIYRNCNLSCFNIHFG